MTLAEREIGDIKLALDLAGLALVEAVAREPKRTTSWLNRVERLASAAGDSAKKAELLVAALAARTIDSKAMARLGRRAGAALEAIARRQGDRRVPERAQVRAFARAREARPEAPDGAEDARGADRGVP